MRDEEQRERPREWRTRQGGITVGERKREGERETTYRGSICRYSTKYVNRCTEWVEDAGACEPSLRALRGWVCPSFRILLRGHRVLLSSATRRGVACAAHVSAVASYVKQRLTIKAQSTIALKCLNMRTYIISYDCNFNS